MAGISWTQEQWSTAGAAGPMNHFLHRADLAMISSELLQSLLWDTETCSWPLIGRWDSPLIGWLEMTAMCPHPHKNPLMEAPWEGRRDWPHWRLLQMRNDKLHQPRIRVSLINNPCSRVTMIVLLLPYIFSIYTYLLFHIIYPHQYCDTGDYLTSSQENQSI